MALLGGIVAFLDRWRLTVVLALATVASVWFHSVAYLQSSEAHHIVVWKIGSPWFATESSPSTGIPGDIQRAAKGIGFDLEVHGFTARSFRRAFLEARAKHIEPDILVINNIGVIKGMPPRNRGGRLEGIDADPDVAASLINVSESLEPLAPRSWKFLVATSRHHAEARALATRPIDCAFRLNGDASAAFIDRRSAPLLDVAQRSVAAFLTQDEAALNALSGGHYPEGALPVERSRTVLGTIIPPVSRSISEVKTCGAWGNRNLAFIDAVATFESANEVGYRSFLAIVGVDDGRPGLLGLGASRDLIGTLRRNQQMLDDGRMPLAMEPPLLIKPADRSSQDRMPIEDRPTLEWRRPSIGGPFMYLIEVQLADGGTDRPERWRGNQFFPVEKEFSLVGRGAAVTKVKAPFGAGHQPYRWRIWAVDRSGGVARSVWRIVFFRN
jgi:hypothetical protein